MYLFLICFKFLLLSVPILISVAFVTLLERKLLGLIGFRLGPNKVSFMGIFQPFSDAIKLSNKQVNYLFNASYFFYYFSSFMMLFSSLILWSSLFSDPLVLSYKFSILIIFIVLGFNSLNSILSGWSTFSKYSLIGSIRTVCQLISYEAVLYMLLFYFILIFGSLSFYNFNYLNLVSLFFMNPVFFYIWIPAILAELNRTPFDFSEGESELVSGFNTEFGSTCFTMIFLSEYSNIIFLSVVTSYLFFFNSELIFLMFSLLYVVFILWVRSVLPRYRYDKLMILAWKFFIPMVTIMFIWYSIELL